MAEFGKFLNKLPISACGLAAYVIEKYRIRFFFKAAVILKTDSSFLLVLFDIAKKVKSFLCQYGKYLELFT